MALKEHNLSLSCRSQKLVQWSDKIL